MNTHFALHQHLVDKLESGNAGEFCSLCATSQLTHLGVRSPPEVHCFSSMLVTGKKDKLCSHDL